MIQQQAGSLTKALWAAVLALAVGHPVMAAEESRDEVLERIRPIGTVAVTGAEKPAEAPSEPDTQAAGKAEEPAGEAEPPAEAEQASAEAGAPEADGQAVYQSACFACHGTGAAGAPKLGDAAAWADRIAKGEETLVTHAIEGFQGDKGMMPPKGGNMSLSDEEVAAAVRYMLAESQ